MAIVNVNLPKGKKIRRVEDIIGEEIEAEAKEADPGELLNLMKIVQKNSKRKVK